MRHNLWSNKELDRNKYLYLQDLVFTKYISFKYKNDTATVIEGPMEALWNKKLKMTTNIFLWEYSWKLPFILHWEKFLA